MNNLLSDLSKIPSDLIKISLLSLLSTIQKYVLTIISGIIVKIIVKVGSIITSVLKKHKRYRYSNLFSDEPEKINSVKTLSELKAAINGLKLKKGSLERKILDKRYNRLLSESLENSTRRRYYELTKILNPNDTPFLGYISCFILGVLCGAIISLCPVMFFSVEEKYKEYMGLLLLLLIIVVLPLIIFTVDRQVYSKAVWRKSFDKDICDSYHYRNHYYPITLSDKSLNKSFELVIWREKQRKKWKVKFGIFGFLFVLFPCLALITSLRGIFLLLWICLVLVIPNVHAPKKETLPEIKTVESENERWYRDKDKEGYFYKLIEYIAHSRDSVLYIGPYAQSCSIPSHYIDLVSTSYTYMSIEELKRNHKSLEKGFYGTIIIDFIVLPDLPDLSEYRVLETVGSLLKFDGELFVRRRKVRGNKRKKAKEKLETDKKTIEKLSDVAYFPTELEQYQMLGFRKNETN